MQLTELEQTLNGRHRSLRTLPGKLLLGSNGARLFADYLEQEPGFLGRIDFIHKLNLPGLFGLELSEKEEGKIGNFWGPCRSRTTYRMGKLCLREEKFITWDDCAVVILHWKNDGEQEVRVRLKAAPGWQVEREKGLWKMRRDCATHRLKLCGILQASAGLTEGELCLSAGKQGRLCVVMAVGEKSADSWQALRERCMSADGDALRARHLEREAAWYAQMPSFHCSDPWLNSVWAYRCFLLRHNYVQPGMGRLRHGLFYEGRSHKLPKVEDHITGHEFTQLIPLSSPLHLTDARWKRDACECRETVLTLLENMDENGLFPTVKIDETGKVYGNFLIWAVWQLMVVEPDTAFVHRILPGLKRNLSGIGQVYCLPGDVLPVCRDHRMTGKEYQPSFWYFDGWPRQVDGRSEFRPLKRVDWAVYYYLNAKGLAELCRMVGDDSWEEYRDLAQRIGEAILQRMWDPETGYFYDLDEQSDRRALTKSVTGIYPLWAGIPGVDASRLVESFLAEGTFRLGSGFASAEQRCPVFSAQGGWNGYFFKGRNGCIWNGPSWPYTTGIALDALAKAVRQELLTGEEWRQMLHEYVLEHFRFGDPEQPYLVEHYDSVTGEMLSDEPDYLHSYLMDLIIRQIAGVQPAPGGICFAPLQTGLQEFALEDVWVDGHRVSVSCRKGLYEAWMDGTCVFRSEEPWAGEKGDSEDGFFVRF